MDQNLRWSIVAAFAAGVFVSVTIQTIYAQTNFKRQRRQTEHGSSNAQPKISHQVEDYSLGTLGIREGIEGCIGNTPLIRIKSLSEETGCEILAKAEFLNGAGNSPKDRVASNIISMVIRYLR